MFRIALINEITQLDKLSAELACFVEAEQLSENTSHWLNIVVEELFVNFVNHGARENGQFELSVECDETNLQLTLKDDGRPFNPLEAELPDVGAVLQDRPVGQLGLHFVRKVSSVITYERLDGCNVVKLTLPRSPVK